MSLIYFSKPGCSPLARRRGFSALRSWRIAVCTTSAESDRDDIFSSGHRHHWQQSALLLQPHPTRHRRLARESGRSPWTMQIQPSIEILYPWSRLAMMLSWSTRFTCSSSLPLAPILLPLGCATPPSTKVGDRSKTLCEQAMYCQLYPGLWTPLPIDYDPPAAIPLPAQTKRDDEGE